jgi:adenine/guanine phosphoribosyltransferase-like PRPP-binding protein
MYFSDGGYSDIQFDRMVLMGTARRIAEQLPKIMRLHNADAVAVTGKSGLSLAFATLMLIDFPLIVVRKPGENSHGNALEGTTGVDVSRYVILDDFMSTGRTVDTIISKLSEYGRRHDEVITPVAVFEYARTAGGLPGRYVVRDGDHKGLHVPVYGKMTDV